MLRFHDGRHARAIVVVDYKTNWLGVEGEDAHGWHYRPAALVAAMQHAHYPLQALLYVVALHRFLRWRLAGYDPDAAPRRRALPVPAGHDRRRRRRSSTAARAACSPGARRRALVVAASDLLDRGRTHDRARPGPCDGSADARLGAGAPRACCATFNVAGVLHAADVHVAAAPRRARPARPTRSSCSPSPLAVRAPRLGPRRAST